MNYRVINYLQQMQGQPGAGAIPASQPTADADRSRPWFQAEQISIGNGYTADPPRICDGYAIEHFGVDEG